MYELLKFNLKVGLMPFRKLVSKQLTEILRTLAHPHRLQIVEEIGAKEVDVNTLQSALGISHSGVSQHLALLRARRIVAERREGRFVFYRLRHPEMATWLLDGLRFIAEEPDEAEQVRQAVDSARAAWSIPPPVRGGGGASKNQTSRVKTPVAR